jgi:hypothetical protein
VPVSSITTTVPIKASACCAATRAALANCSDIEVAALLLDEFADL